MNRALVILLLCVGCSTQSIPPACEPAPLVKIVVEGMLENPAIRESKFISEEASGVFFLDKENTINGSAHGADYNIAIQ